jgi:dTDP-4-dehydrorhamnose reductase
MLKFGAEREELKVVADQIGSPTSARFIAAATAALIAKTQNRPADFFHSGSALTSGIYNLVCSGEISWHGFAEEIFTKATQLGFPLAVKRIIPIKTSDLPTPAARPLNSRLSTEKISKALAITPPHWRDELSLILHELCPGYIEKKR